MGIRIVIDSTSDVTQEFIEKHNLSMVPLTVNFDGELFLDKVEITSKDFFQRLIQSEKLPTTSQVSPGDFSEVFKKILDEGDEVLGIFLAPELSGTPGSAKIAKDMIESDKIHIIDTRSVTLGSFAVIKKAVDLVEEGKSVEEIIKIIENCRDKVEAIAIVDTLKYLEKGGRLSKNQAIIGSILNIKPVIKIADGKLTVIEKLRGKNKAIKWVDEWIEKNNFDLSNKTVFIYHSTNEEQANVLRDTLQTKYNIKEIIQDEIGSVIGTHAGPGALAISFLND